MIISRSIASEHFEDSYQVLWGFPGDSVGKESTCSEGGLGSIPGLGRSPGEGLGYPLQYSWASPVVQMVKNHLQCGRLRFDPWVGKMGRAPGEGKGYPLQYSGNTGKSITLTIWTFVGKVMSLLFNMLSRLVLAFLPRSKLLLIS